MQWVETHRCMACGPVPFGHERFAQQLVWESTNQQTNGFFKIEFRDMLLCRVATSFQYDLTGKRKKSLLPSSMTETFPREGRRQVSMSQFLLASDAFPKKPNLLEDSSGI